MELKWFALAAAVVFNVLANVALKESTRTVPEGASLERILLGTIGSGFFWLGAVSALLLLGAYLLALRGVPLATAYATVTSLALVGLALVGTVAFGESLSATSIAGMALVILGVGLMTSSVGV